MIKLAIVGACGRMGRRIGALAVQDDQFQIACALEQKGHPEMDSDYDKIIGSSQPLVCVTETLITTPDVLIDFSTPASTAHWVDVCRGQKIPMVIGSTGLGTGEIDLIESASKDIPIVHAPNMSVGVNVLLRLVGELAKSLGPDYDIEIVEAHHRHKKDAPSGTALALLKAVCEATGADPGQAAVFGRHGVDQVRKKGQIGVHAIRLGDTVGEHSVSFGTGGETVTIAHSAHSRDTFVSGALRAAKWVAGRSAGLYSMRDVLFGGE